MKREACNDKKDQMGFYFVFPFVPINFSTSPTSCLFSCTFSSHFQSSSPPFSPTVLALPPLVSVSITPCTQTHKCSNKDFNTQRIAPYALAAAICTKSFAENYISQFSWKCDLSKKLGCNFCSCWATGHCCLLPLAFVPLCCIVAISL